MYFIFKVNLEVIKVGFVCKFDYNFVFVLEFKIYLSFCVFYKMIYVLIEFIFMI